MARTADGQRVRIHYLRLPDREDIFEQRLVFADDRVLVTLSEPLVLAAPITVEGDVILEEGSRAVWFTFPGQWHDVGRFHRADGRFTGVYANVLTPPRIDGPTWHTTDLFLDVWIPAGGEARVLDEDELEEAERLAHIDPETAERARAEASRLIGRARRGTWPPAVVREWTLERALGRAARASEGA